MYQDPAQFVLVVVLNLLLAWNSIPGKLQLHRKFKVVVDLVARHSLKVPIESLESDDQEGRQFVEISLAGGSDLFVQDLGVVHVVTFEDVLLGKGREGFS